MTLNKASEVPRLARGVLVALLVFVGICVLNAQCAYAATTSFTASVINSYAETAGGAEVANWGSHQTVYNEGTDTNPDWVIMVNPQAVQSSVTNKPTKEQLEVYSGQDTKLPETTTKTVNGSEVTVTNWTYDKTTGLLHLKIDPPKGGITVYNNIYGNQTGTGVKVYGLSRNNSASGVAWGQSASLTATDELVSAENITGSKKAYRLKANGKEDDPDSDIGDLAVYNLGFPADPAQSAKNSNYYLGFARYNVSDVNVYAVYPVGGVAKYAALLGSADYDYNKKTHQLQITPNNNYTNLVVVATLSEKDGVITPKLKERTTNSITIWRAANQPYYFSLDGDHWEKLEFGTDGKCTACGKNFKLSNGGITATGLDVKTGYYFKAGSGDDAKEKKLRTLSNAESEAALVPLDGGEVFDAVINVHGNDGIDSDGGSTFHCTIKTVNYSGESDEINKVKNDWGDDNIENTPCNLRCTSHGAAYTTNKDYNGFVKITSINQKTGTVRGWAWSDQPMKQGNGQNIAGSVVFDASLPLEIEIEKLVNDDYVTPANNNDAYTLNNAKFTVRDETANKDVKTVTLSTKSGESNKVASAKVENLDASHKYSVIEETAPEGYAFNSKETKTYTGKVKTIYKVEKITGIDGEGGDTVTIKVADATQTGVPFKITKYDDTTKESFAQGDGSLENVIYKVSYYGTHQKNKKSDVETRTWYLKTLYEDVDGEKTATAKFDAAHLVNNSDYPSNDFYKLSDGTIVCPLGSYYVKEVFIPDNDGYLLSDNTERYFDFDVTAEQGQSTKTSFNMREQAQSSAGSDVDAFDKLTKYYNTVKRGELELIKADANYRTYQKPRTDGQAANDGDSQGNATFENALYAVVNRSRHYVISPLDGATKIMPGELVCTIKTDKTGYASTNQSLLNGWQKPVAWHGSLAYGDYEVFEIQAPEGYLLGQWNNDAVTYYSLRTTSTYSSMNNSVLSGLNADQAKSKYGFANTDPLRNTFKPGSTVTRISPIGTDKALKHAPSGYSTIPQPWINADKVMVSFTSHGADPDPARLRDVGVLPEHWSEDTVQRGNIEIIKADDTLRSHEVPRTPGKVGDSQGNATFENAVYSVVNRSVHSVLSPETGEVIQPGQVVCRIKTDETGKATTNNAAANGWSVPAGWRGALPYGDYEIFEIEAPVGYMLGHWKGIDITYYSLCTDHGSSAQNGGKSLLCGDSGNVNSPNLTNAQAVAFGFKGASNIYDKEYLNGWFYGPKNDSHVTIQRNFPDNSSHKWIDIDQTTVTFTTRDTNITDDLASHWSEDTPKRADIELDKADDTLNTTPTDRDVVDYAGRTDPQGDASLKDAKFAIINRSHKVVVNPFGELVQPGHVVCFIYTDEKGHASTKLTEERMRINRWDQVTATALDGQTYGVNGNAPDGKGAIWAIAKGWHGALPYGEYEVFEVQEPEGYLNGHWFDNIQTKWAAMAVVNGESSPMASIAGTEEFKNSFKTEHAAEFATAYINDAVNPQWFRIYANSPHKWIEVDNLEWYKENGKANPFYPSLDSDTDEVQFTQDALKNGSTHTSSLDSYVNNPTIKKEQRFEDTVMRGNLDLQKVDEDFESSENGKIGNTIEDKDAVSGTGNNQLDGKNPITITNGRGHLEGAVFGVYNRSKTVVVSPVTGKEIAPNGLVCKIITNTYGYASTELTPENIRYNEWDRKYVNGIKDYDNGKCWATENGWKEHGALAYGQYEVIEITPPTGYLMNKTWHGMATKDVGEVLDAEANTRVTADTELHAILDSTTAAAEIGEKGVSLDNKREVKPNGSKNWDWAADHRGWITQTDPASTTYPSNYPLADKKTAPPITRIHSYTGIVDNKRSNYTNVSRSTWINEDKVLLCFGTVQEDHYEQNGRSAGNLGTENLNASSVYADQVKGGPVATTTKTDNDQTWVEDAIVRGGVKIGKIDRQNQQYKAQGKGSLANHVIGIFSTNPNPVTVYQMDEVNANWKDTKTVSGVTLTKNGQDSNADITVNIVDPNVIPEKIEANAAGIYGSPYQDKRVDDKISWTYPGWIYKDKADAYMQMSGNKFTTRPFAGANSDAYFPGIYYYWPDQGVQPEFGKQTADGVFIGYITTREVTESDGTVKYVASTDADTLPYGTYTLREMYVPSTTGYLFDEVSMSWHESFGIGDDFAYVEHDLNDRYKDNSDYYGKTVDSDQQWYKNEMTDKNGWFWHETDYRFKDDYQKNNGASDSTRGMNLYYYTGTSDESKVFNSDKSAYYLPGAYHNRYTDDPANNTGQSGVRVDGDYYHRVVPSDAHDLSLNNKFVDFTEAGIEKTDGEKNYRFAISNYIRRGDLVFTKNDAESKRLAGIPFLITSKTTGESHIVLTDSNGSYDSRQSENYPIRAHSYHTNENDAALVQKSAAGIPFLNITVNEDGTKTIEAMSKIANFDEKGYWVDETGATPALDWDYGLWFNGRVDAFTNHAQIHSSGAGSDSSADFFADKGVPDRDMQAELNQNGYRGDEAFYVDNPPIAAYNPRYVATAGTSVFQSPLGALPYDDYIIQELKLPARVIQKDNETYKLVDNGDFMMISNNEFSIDHRAAADSTETVYATYPGGILQTSFNTVTNNTFALFDGLDLENIKPKVGTTLSTMKWPDVKHYGEVRTDTTLYDHVQYENLASEHNYYIYGELHRLTVNEAGDREDAGIIAVSGANGENAFNTKDTTSGMMEIEFNFNASDVGEGESTVAFEYIFDAETTPAPLTTPVSESVKGGSIAWHADIQDAGQTVSFPSIGTTLTGPSSAKEAMLDKQVTLTDTIAYHGLTPGESYIATGTLMKVDEKGDVQVALDKDGQPVKSEDKTFVPEKADGIVEVTFTFTTTEMKGTGLVAYEEVYEDKYGARGELVAEHKDPKDGKQTIYVPDIHTMATDANTGEHFGLAAGEVSITDEVAYTNLTYGQKYLMTGVLMNRETGREYTDGAGKTYKVEQVFTAGGDDAVREAPVYYYTDANGQEVVVTDKAEGDTVEIDGKEYKVEMRDDSVHHRASGTMMMDFNLTNVETLEGVSLVVYESCAPVEGDVEEGGETPETGDVVAVHEDIDDEGQTVNYPGVHTTATDEVTGSHYGRVDGKTTINDDVEYTNLIAGETYSVSGVLMDKDTNAPLLDADGQKIESKVVFVAGEGQEGVEAGSRVSGTVRVPFEVSSELLRGKTTVVFENLYYNNKLVGVHADINDEDQTVRYPDIHTMALFDDQTKTSYAKRDTGLVDTVSFENLEPGREYTVSGVIHYKKEVDRTTHEVVDDGIALDPFGNEVRATATFTPEVPSGTVEVRFVFDSRAMTMRNTVVFETLYTTPEDGGEEIVVARHEDINDEDQTVWIDRVEDELNVQPAVPMVKTGDAIPWVIGGVIIASLAAIGAFAWQRRRNRKMK